MIPTRAPVATPSQPLDDSIRYEVSSADQDDRWDAFVEQHANPHLEQSSLWGGIQGLRRWKAVRLLALRGERIVAGAQVLEKPVGRFAKVGYVFRGPLRHPEEGPDPAAFLGALRSFARRRGLTYLAVVPAYGSNAEEPQYLAQGFFDGPPLLPPTSAMLASLVLDLDESPEAMVARMPRMTRRNIRYGQERGLQAVDGTAADIPVFADLMIQLCKRRGTSPNVPTGRFLDTLWSRMAPRGLAKLILTRFQDAPVSAILVFRFGAWCRAWRAGWTGEHTDKRPNELMYWESMRWARSVGCRYYDFVGIDSQVALELVAGAPVDLDRIRQQCSMSSFKLGFGGTVIPPVHRFCLFPNRLLGPVLQRGIPLLLRSRHFQKLLRERVAS